MAAVNRDNPQTLDELKIAISKAVQELESEVIDRALSEFKNRMERVTSGGGGHIEI